MVKLNTGHGRARPKLLRGRQPAELDSRRWRTAEVGGLHEHPAAGWDREGLGSAVARRVRARDFACQEMRCLGAVPQKELTRRASRRGVDVDA